MPKKTAAPAVDEQPPADCRHVSSQGELDEALADRATAPNVCIHLRADAEESVRAWETTTRAAPEIAGQW